MSTDLLILTADIVSAYVSKNPIQAKELPQLVSDTYKALVDVEKDDKPRPEPAVPIKKSIQPDHIVCLEDGAKLKMLKRYLRTRYDMSPDEYRARWGLPSDYPMVCPEYSERRSQFAKKIGLGKTK